ncbi:MAG: acetylxylan esterase [Candidatus Woesearchaeota archaeon]
MRVKKRTLKILALAFVILIAVFIIVPRLQGKVYRMGKDSFSYSTERGKPEFQISLRSQNNNFDVYDISFASRKFLDNPTLIYGILLMPKATNVPGVVLLPGGGITKEAELKHAEIIANMGYAVLTIDQRGIGQTGGYYLSLEDDYKLFSQGKEPVQHMCVFDALRATDVLKEVKNVDKTRIAIAGLSMGGRYAIIAAALDKNIKGVIAISSAGFHISNDNSPENKFMLSIDPDNYIARISPNKLVMIHGSNDSKVPLEEAEQTFAKAKEPKVFNIAQGCGHGYCEAMHDDLSKALSSILG